MKDEKNVFQDTRNMLLMVRVLSRLENERKNNNSLDQLLCKVEEENGYSNRVPLINQSTFLAMLYSTALWLRESLFNDPNAVEILRKHVKPFITRSDIKITYGADAVHFTEGKSEQFSRRIRNAVAHASVEITGSEFVFRDRNTRKNDDWVQISMSWDTTGEYTSALITAGNELLYPQL